MAKAQHLIPISADWILMRIQKGKKVRLKNAKIEGVIDLSKLDLPTKTVDRTDFQKNVLKLPTECKIIDSLINISDSEFTGDVDFSNCIFNDISRFDGAAFSKGAVFDGATFSGYAVFDGATFSGYAGFDGATFGRDAVFDGATFSGNAGFDEATFSGNARFGGVTFGRDAVFDEATLSRGAGFDGATFRGNALFFRATFRGNALFFRATFSGDAVFSGCTFEGDVLTFRDATFTYPRIQEDACRRAKNVLAKAGNRDEEEYHFYREMVAKRIQKGIRGNSGRGLRDCLKRFFVHDVLEFIFIQMIFGYGVHPVRILLGWLAFVGMFAIIFWVKGVLEEPVQWYDYWWFSITTAATAGSAYKPLGLFRFIAGIEAILGTFMWAAFITTFARKFSR